MPSYQSKQVSHSIRSRAVSVLIPCQNLFFDVRGQNSIEIRSVTTEKKWLWSKQQQQGGEGVIFYNLVVKFQQHYKHVGCIMVGNNFLSSIFDFLQLKIGILFPKMFGFSVRKKFVTVIEKKVLKFEAEVRKFSKILRSLEQFIQTVKDLKNFW